MNESGKPLDTTAAEAYEKLLVPTINGPWAREAVELAAPAPGEQVLDVACGTGIEIRLLAERLAPGGRVVGLDIDPAMIAVARSLAPAPEGFALEWHCGSALEMPFGNATFDLALCLQGIQFLPDPAAGLAEMRRVLKPDGRLVAMVWRTIEHCKGQHALVQALERRNVDAKAARQPFSLGDPHNLGRLVSESGFRNVDVRFAHRSARFASARHFVDSLAAGGPSTRHAMAKVPAHELGGLYDEVAAALRQYEDKDGVAIPVASLIVLARP